MSTNRSSGTVLLETVLLLCWLSGSSMAIEPGTPPRVEAHSTAVDSQVIQPSTSRIEAAESECLHRIIALPAVQDELRLSTEQRPKVCDLCNHLHEQMAVWREYAGRGLSSDEIQRRAREFWTQKRELLGKFQNQVFDLLDEIQCERLKQLVRQARGAFALQSERLANELGLTDEQRCKLREQARQHAESMRETWREARQHMADVRHNWQESHDRLERERKAFNARMRELLTPEQRQKYDHLLGVPFSFPRSQMGEEPSDDDLNLPAITPDEDEPPAPKSKP